MDEILSYVVVPDEGGPSNDWVVEVLCHNGSESQLVSISVKRHIDFTTRFNYGYSIA